jgi:hypothetical protein
MDLNGGLSWAGSVEGQLKNLETTAVLKAGAGGVSAMPD